MEQMSTTEVVSFSEKAEELGTQQGFPKYHEHACIAE
jgi:uncharacterized protein YunC (DUF1805 family)